MRGPIPTALALASLILAAGAAPAAAQTVHPGVQTITGGRQCTANFIFRDSASTYIGQAAHCSGSGSAIKTDGCTTRSLPLGTPVRVRGASAPGTMVYNSWLAMQAAGERDRARCRYNDFALVRIGPADVPKVDPTVPRYGGPTGVGSAKLLATVYSYGNSSLRLGIRQLSPKQGVVVQKAGGGWTDGVVTVTPGIPGDSGSGFMNAAGQAVGVLSTLAVLPLPLTNGVGNLSRELAYMRSHSSLTTVRLVPGTKPFRPDLVRAILTP